MCEAIGAAQIARGDAVQHFCHVFQILVQLVAGIKKPSH